MTLTVTQNPFFFQVSQSQSDQSLATSSAGRRRHKSAAVPSMAKSVPLKPLSQDDMLLTRSHVCFLILENNVSLQLKMYTLV